MSIHPLLLSCVVVLAACASSNDVQRADADATCEQPSPALGSVVVRRDRCVVTTEEDRQEARRRAREIIEEQNRGRNSARVGGMGS